MRPPSLRSGRSFCVEKENALEVDVVEAVQIFFRHLVERGVMGGAGVVHQEVEAVGPHPLQGFG